MTALKKAVSRKPALAAQGKSASKKNAVRHFIDLADIDARELRRMLDAAVKMKKLRGKRGGKLPLQGKKLAMIFEKPSTRTRVSFEVAMHELGGHPIYLHGNDMQLGRGESIADTAKVLSRYVDAVLIRANSHFTLAEMARSGTIPVINGLTNMSHPCQLMADIMTFEQHRGPIKGKTIAWVGDGNNVANSFISAAAKFGFTLRLACPPTLRPSPQAIAQAKKAGATIELLTSPVEAVRGAHAVVTDTWVSMGDTDGDTRTRALSAYQVNDYLMSQARRDALFLHCLPAHRGEEVTAAILDGPQSVVWDEAENRLHAQKAVLLWCLNML